MLARDSLKVSARFMTDLIACNALALLGDEEGSRRLLRQLAQRAEREVPVIKGVVEALDRIDGELNATDGRQPMQWTRWGMIPARPAQPDLNPANDHADTSEQPSLPVA